VTIDPTPSGNVDLLGRGGDGWTARLGRFTDTMKFHWNKWVIEYDLASQLALFKQVGSVFEDVAGTVRRSVGNAKQAARVGGPVAIGLALVIAVVLWRRRRRRLGIGGGRNRQRARKRSPIGQIYEEVARALAKAGAPRDAAVTPRELADRLAARGAETAPQLGELTDLYYAAEWGHHSDAAAEQRAHALADEIRGLLRASR
jgi:hypothetical protein